MNKTLKENQVKAVQNYPEGYNNRGEASQVSDGSVKQLIKSVIQMLNESEEPVANVHAETGNTIVHGYKVHPEDGGGIRIIVSKNFEEIYLDNEVFSK